jgi:hypothetical protein
MLNFKENNLRLLQSAREFYKKLVLALKGCDFQGNSVDPCLWTKNTEHGILFDGIYVNDCLVIGNDNGIHDVIMGSKPTNLG